MTKNKQEDLTEEVDAVCEGMMLARGQALEIFGTFASLEEDALAVSEIYDRLEVLDFDRKDVTTLYANLKDCYTRAKNIFQQEKPTVGQVFSVFEKTPYEVFEDGDDE